MEFNQFVNEVKGGIKQFLPIEYEDAQVRIEEVKKLNENYLGITVLKENQVIAPTFNLNQLYKMYQSDPEISILEQTSCISFYAAECSEFPVLGEVHHDLTLPEALEAYEKIPAERMNGLKSVGFNLQEGGDYDGMMDLMVAGRSQREILDSIPFYRENKLVQEALKRVEQYIEEKPLNVEKTRPKEEKGEIQKTKSQKRREDMSL